MSDNYQILGLDVGDARIGVAMAGRATKLASPLTTIKNDNSTMDIISNLVKDNEVKSVVIGLPRNLNGDDTPQTAKIRLFADQVEKTLNIKVYLIDEALTSKKAEKELLLRHRPFKREEIDALAATYILEDFFSNKDNI